jgi:hypothetical protein
MRDTVFVFARAPRLGAVKRRLGMEIGARAALQFHHRTMIALLRGLTAERRVRTVLAQTPDRTRFPLPVRVERIGQGGGNPTGGALGAGDLGARMQRAASRVKRGRVVIIGCDIPDARAADVVAAFRALGRADAIFGPAEDGGYWLVGLSPRRPARPFAGVRWSTEHALADTLANFAGRRVIMLRTLRDVDTAADLRSVRRCRP